MLDHFNPKLAALAGLLLAAAAPVRAQIATLFYAETEKDGVFYCFNNPDQYKAWKESGDIGKTPISVPEAGPDGELLICDSEAGVDLYNFKHSRPAYERPAPKIPSTKFADWKDGKTTIEGKFAKIVLSNRIQIRWTYNNPGDDMLQSRGSFRVRRAKTSFEGWIYNKDLTYKLQLNWADTSSSLEDAWINYDVFHNKAFQIRAGQFKAATGRQELTSSGRQQFVDRSIVSAAFAPGYQAGVQVGGDLGPDARFSYAVGLFNGNGRNQANNDNNRYLWAARLQYQPLGDVGYSESDFESAGMKPLVAVALQYTKNNLAGVTTGAITYTPPAGAAPGFWSTANNDLDVETVSADLAVKWRGFSLFGEYYRRNNTYELGPVRIRTNPTQIPTPPYAANNVYAGDFDSRGLAVQAGYFLYKRTFEIAARYAAVDPSEIINDNEQTERGVSLNWFWNKHAHKLQFDYRRLTDDSLKLPVPAGAALGTIGTRRNDTEIRLQYQFIF